MDSNQLVKFGQYLLSQERKKRFQRTTRQNKKDGIDIISTRERLALVHDADVANFFEEFQNNPDIQYTPSKEVILR